MAYKEKDTKKWTAQWFETTAKGEKKKGGLIINVTHWIMSVRRN